MNKKFISGSNSIESDVKQIQTWLLSPEAELYLLYFTQVSAVFTVAKAAEGGISFEAKLWSFKLQLMYIAKELKGYFHLMFQKHREASEW